MLNKKGETVITTPLVLLISIAFIMILTVFCINMITPFIWYQKIQLVANKYMYVIDRYGYLTSLELTQMKNELKSEGLDINSIKITAPTSKKTYGTLIELKIEYNAKQDIILLDNKSMTRVVPLVIRKYSYSKV